MNGKWNEIKNVGGVLITALSGILSSIGVSFFCMLTVSGCLIHVPHDFYHLPKRIVVGEYYRIVIYLLGFQRHLKLEYLPMSSGAAQHFVDVQRMIHLGGVATLISLFVFVLMFKTQKKRYQLYQLVPLFKQLGIFLIVLTVLILISFQDSFLWFHEHFFRNNNWLFNPRTDPIIIILDQRFFVKYFVGWILFSLLYILAILKYMQSLINFFISRRRQL